MLNISTKLFITLYVRENFRPLPIITEVPNDVNLRHEIRVLYANT